MREQAVGMDEGRNNPGAIGRNNPRPALEFHRAYKGNIPLNTKLLLLTGSSLSSVHSLSQQEGQM